MHVVIRKLKKHKYKYNNSYKYYFKYNIYFKNVALFQMRIM